MKDPAFIEKMKKGPVAMMNVLPSGPPRMGTSLVQWFLFVVLVGIFTAYVTGRALLPGPRYLEVFRFAGTTAFMTFALGHMPSSIWMGRTWAATFRSMFDGLVYSLLMAGVFGWLWPGRV
jgi:hypothetical protein